MQNQLIFESSYEALTASLAVQGLEGRRFCILCDENTYRLYADKVAAALLPLARETLRYVLPAGEEHKNLASVSEVYRFLLAQKFDRSDILLTLGGGVIGDLGGFVAATYLRGISYVQLPTTLLAQVDSSIGGKTAVDFDAYKNMVGAFYLPLFTYANTESLRTLDETQFASGMAELIKTALLDDAKLFQALEEEKRSGLEIPADALQQYVQSAAGIKQRIVTEDPREEGIRALLNLGHTIGHAIEREMNFSLPHGHCVALGTIAAAEISRKRCMFKDDEFARLVSLFLKEGLPVSRRGLDTERILLLTKSDKKMRGGQIRFVLLDGIGKAVLVDDVSDDELRLAITSLSERT